MADREFEDVDLTPAVEQSSDVQEVQEGDFDIIEEVEESSEALAGVAFLIAVLVGVAPRVVLPASWRLRRAVDAQTLELPERLPGRSAPGDVVH